MGNAISPDEFVSECPQSDPLAAARTRIAELRAIHDAANNARPHQALPWSVRQWGDDVLDLHIHAASDDVPVIEAWCDDCENRGNHGTLIDKEQAEVIVAARNSLSALLTVAECAEEYVRTRSVMAGASLEAALEAFGRGDLMATCDPAEFDTDGVPFHPGTRRTCHVRQLHSERHTANS